MIGVQSPITVGGGSVELVHPQGVVSSRLMIGRQATAWTLPEQIAITLGDRILTEEIAPGNRIGEEALAKEFQVSRGPIRDALKMLEHVGLLVITNRRGAIASLLTRDDLREIMELREHVFELAIQGFGRELKSESVSQLRRHVSALDAVATEPQFMLLYTDALDRIMLFLAYHCGNNRIGQILTTLSLQSFRYFARGLTRGPDASARRDVSLKFYRDLVTAYEEKKSIEPLIARLRQIYAESKLHFSDYLR